MLQIIGWLGCFYLVVKALEIYATNVRDDANGGVTPASVVAIGAAILGAGAFAFWIYAQGAAVQSISPAIPATIQAPVGVTPEELFSDEKAKCISQASSEKEMDACENK
jgi:hypothetical protein